MSSLLMMVARPARLRSHRLWAGQPPSKDAAVFLARANRANPGGVRRLVIPPSLGYGDRLMGAIPPNSVLVFEIRLLSVDQ
jgi:hypothetical protein